MATQAIRSLASVTSLEQLCRDAIIADVAAKRRCSLAIYDDTRADDLDGVAMERRALLRARMKAVGIDPDRLAEALI